MTDEKKKGDCSPSPRYIFGNALVGMHAPCETAEESLSQHD